MVGLHRVTEQPPDGSGCRPGWSPVEVVLYVVELQRERGVDFAHPVEQVEQVAMSLEEALTVAGAHRAVAASFEVAVPLCSVRGLQALQRGRWIVFP